MNNINEIFPLAYPGKGGFFDHKNVIYPYPQYNGSRNNDLSNVFISPGCGGGGLCLANHDNYLSNKQTLSRFETMIASQGFGAGGRGVTIVTSCGKCNTVDGTNGMDGCVIIASLI